MNALIFLCRLLIQGHIKTFYQKNTFMLENGILQLAVIIVIK